MLVELSVMEQRYQAVIAVVQDGWKVVEVAGRLGVSRQRPADEGPFGPVTAACVGLSMSWKGGDQMARWEGFRQCPGCGLDIATGEGERSCAWGECPYLPGELDVYCPNCRFNFFTMEGNPPCENPMTCDHAAEARGHVENLRSWVEHRPR